MLVLLPVSTMAQSNYKLNSGASVSVSGTSNVHDWTMTSTGVESQGGFKVNSRDELIGLTNLSFVVQSKSLKSGKSSMDNRTYKSIKADEFPKISYQLKSAILTLKGDKYNIATTGNLTIAGVTQSISMLVTAVVNANKTITCKGSEKLKLTDYKIDPPSFMLGAMKVGNDLVIQFDLTYSK
jgi:polyisoprenoid-binding protein YceI